MLIIGEPDLPLTLQAGNITITSSKSVELLGITIDYKLTFSDHINSLCRKARFNLVALNRIRKYVSANQVKLLLNSYIISVFTYAPIVWMFCGKTLNGEIEKVHKRALRAVLSDFSSNYEELLNNSFSKRIHCIHLYHLLCEVFKTLQGINPPFMQSFFVSKPTRYNLRDTNLLTLPLANTQRYGTQSFNFRGSLLWNSLSVDIKSTDSIQVFKRRLKTLNLQQLCNCKICQ